MLRVPLLLRASLRLAWRSIKHMPRIVLIAATLLLFAGAAVLLSLRYWVLPDIGRYHADITAMASRAIGQPVIIGKVEADWRGIRPHLRFTDVRILDALGQTALVLPRIDNVISWTTLISGEVRLHSVEFDQPNLQLKRDAQGVLHIAGVTLPSQMPGQITGRAGDADWLLQPARIVVRNASITWQDEQQAAPLMALSNVNLVIENRKYLPGLSLGKNWSFAKDSGNRHSFALRALPPPELSGELDIRGDFYGDTFNDMPAWRGQLYTHLDYVDVAAWRPWLPLSEAVSGGKGAMRMWLGIADGKLDNLTADMALLDVQAQLAADVLPLDLLSLRGRFAWHDTAGFEISTQKLAVNLRNGLQVPATDLYVRLADSDTGKMTSGEVRANRLELVNLANLSDFLPLDHSLKQQLAEYAPRGIVSDLQAEWQGGTGKPLHYQVKARFDDLSLQRVGKVPGFSGLSGYVNGSDEQGMFSLNARQLTVDAPQTLAEPLSFDTLTGQGGWKINENGFEVNFKDVFVANEDIAGNLFGSYQSSPPDLGTPPGRGTIDLTVHLTRAAVNQAARYIPPFVLGSKTHDWLRSALLEGQSDEFRLRLSGNLNEFPFDGNHNGIFQIQARASNVTLEYAKGWPRVENAAAELLINGKRLTVTAPTAMTAGGRVQKISVVLPDIVSPQLLLQIQGEAVDETQRSLDFIWKSPVRGYLGGVTDGVMARGKGKLMLQMEVPLSSPKPAKISGSYHFTDNDISLGRNIPMLMAVNGDLLFTESSLMTRNVSAKILGGPASIVAQMDPDGAVRVKASGQAVLGEMRTNAPHPLLHYLQGGAPWKAEITGLKKQVEIVVTSDLVGLSSKLPMPFSKAAVESIPLRLERKTLLGQHDLLTVKYGNVLSAKILRNEKNGIFQIKRGLVSLGSQGTWPDRDGLWISGTVPEFSVRGWGPLMGASDGPPLISRGGADLRIKKVSGYGYKMDDVRIMARTRNNLMVAQVSSDALNGEVRWQSYGKGKLTARLKNLLLEKDENDQTDKDSSAVPAPAAANSEAAKGFAALDVIVDTVTLNGKHLGKLELQGQQQDQDWRMENLLLTNPDGVLKADGKWQMGPNLERTKVNLQMDISNAGNVLARSGYPNTVKNGSGTLHGEFAWVGGPADFSYPKLGGSLSLNTGKGQFLKIDPGVGKLLSILSLQSLPQHISLDFADVFSQGFTFDSIIGTAQIDKGVLTTRDFKISGSSAKVTMSGQVDLVQETQNLRMRVLPTLGDSVSLLGFAAGPAVGVGVYLANKILRNPLDQLAAFEYNVSGTWANPNVEKVSRKIPQK